MKAEDSKVTLNLFATLFDFGRFHIIQYFLICLPLIMVSMMNVNYIFVAETVKFRCRVPECENLNDTYSTPTWWPESADTKCLRPIFNLTGKNETCSNQEEIYFEQCDEWIYEHKNSVITQLDIGCQSWKISLVGSIHNVGMLFSMMLMGWIADKFGRKPTIIICAVGGTIGVLKIFVQNFYTYLAVEFLESFIASGLYTVAIVWSILALDYVTRATKTYRKMFLLWFSAGNYAPWLYEVVEVGGETKRVAAGVIFSYAIYVGEVLFAFIAMSFQYWKSLILAAYTPTIVFIVYTIMLQESTRWQLLRGKTAEARTTLKTIAKINKLKISNDEIDNISEDDLRIKCGVAFQKEKESFKHIIESKEIMTRLAVTSFCLFTASFVYYGLAVQAVSLPGDKYLNFALTSLTSFPGDLLVFLTFQRYGRKIPLQSGFIACSVFIMAQAFIPDSITWLKIMLFLFGKLGTALCFTGIYTYSLELFPTSVRGSLFGFCNTFARVGSMLSPLTPLLVSELTALPSILFASTAIVAAVLLSFTPETKSLPLFDTIHDVEVYEEKITTRF